ncbi:MAG TPA: hypothetical protein VFZ78_00950 [Flavisolibacter sp.]
MSFNNNDINQINRNNYEEFLILYMDQELSADQMNMVDAFLDRHPDLKAEFELLLGTRLVPETVSFNKEALLSDQMKINMLEEDLLLYVDDELPAARRSSVEASVAADPSLKEQLQLLQRTKLDPAETMVFANKEMLYRRTQVVFRFTAMLRIAAAVLVVLFMGILYYLNSGTTDNNGNTTANVDKPRQVTPVQVPPQEPQESPSVQMASTKDFEQEIAPYVSGKGTTKKTVQQQDVQLALMVQPDAVSPNIQRNTAPVTVSETVNNNVVTSSAPDRITVIPAASTVPNDVAVTGPAPGNKGSVKGFLRKATRLIEKRTGIDPTNDKEEILIGVLAIKLN